MTRIQAALAAGLLVSLAGCNGKDDDTAGVCEPGTVSLTDANNFTYSGDLTLPVYTTVSAADVNICWDQVINDLQCHGMDPATEIDNVAMVRYPLLTHEEIQNGLSQNQLNQADIGGYLSYEPEDGETCINLDSMTLFGTEVDIADQYNLESESYMLLLATGTSIGVGTRMLAFLEPSETSDNTQVDVEEGCSVLDFEADVQSSEDPLICGEGSWPIEWSTLTADGLGNELQLSDVDNLSLGFYEGVSAADLESQFLDLELIATTWWSLDLEEGVSADLADAATTDGQTFDGFGGDGVYVLALRCSSCYNPAPLFLTVLNPG